MRMRIQHRTSAYESRSGSWNAARRRRNETRHVRACVISDSYVHARRDANSKNEAAASGKSDAFFLSLALAMVEREREWEREGVAVEGRTAAGSARDARTEARLTLGSMSSRARTWKRVSSETRIEKLASGRGPSTDMNPAWLLALSDAALARWELSIARVDYYRCRLLLL